MSDLSGKVSLDTTDYKSGVAELNRQIRVIESGFRSSAAAMGDWDQKSAGLVMRTRALRQEIEVQRKIVAATAAEYKKAAAEKGADSRAAQELQIKLARQTETLNKMKSELKETSKLSAQFGTAMKAVGTAAKVGAAAVAGAAAAVAGLGLAVGKMVFNAASSADALQEMADKTGIGTERLQELSYVGAQLGTDLDTITGANARLIRSMNSAQGGSKEAKKAFADLGVSVVGVDGKLRSQQAVFREAIDKLGRMSNETERDALAMEIFGKSAQELNPLIKAGGDEIIRLGAEARKMGAVMDQNAVSSLAELKDMLDGLKMGLQGTLGTLAGAFLPGFKGVMGAASGYLQTFGEIVRGSGGDVGKMADGVGGLLSQMVQDVAKKAPEMLKAGLGLLKGIVSGIVGNLPVLLPAVIEIILSLVRFVVEMLPMLLVAAVQVVVTLATGIAQALPELIPTVLGIIPVIIQTLVESLPLLLNAALMLILALVQGLVTALPMLIEAGPQIMTTLVQAVITMLPMLLVAAVQIITMLAMGLIQNLPLLFKATAQIISGVINVFKTTDWGKIGKDLVAGISKGFNQQWANFKASVVANFNGMVDSIKKLLGISSPSKVFAGMGKNMGLGLLGGFAQQMESVRAGMLGQVKGLNLVMNGAMAGGYGGSLTQHSETRNYYAPVIYQSAQEEARKTARRW